MAKKTHKQNLDPIVITPKMVEDAKKQYPELFPGTKEHDEYLKRAHELLALFS